MPRNKYAEWSDEEGGEEASGKSSRVASGKNASSSKSKHSSGKSKSSFSGGGWLSGWAKGSSKPASKKKKKPPPIPEDDYLDEEEDDDMQRDDLPTFDPGGGPAPFYSKLRTGFGGPTCWADVDEQFFEEEAENLISAVTRTQFGQEKGSVLNSIFKSSVVENKEVLDPLGLGAIDLAQMQLVEPGTTTTDLEQQAVLINKWHRTKGSAADGTAGAEAGGSPGGASGSGGGAAGGQGGPRRRGSQLPPELAVLVPNEEAFSPELYLATFHTDLSERELRKGIKVLSHELSERTGLLKALVRDNFDRFTSCKSTIDDIYAKLKKVEAVTMPAAGQAPGAGAGAGGSSTEAVQRAIEAAQANARRTFGAVLDRASKTDRIKSVTNLLRRFHSLFGMPGRIKALWAEGDMHSVVAEYRRANALIRPTPATARVWVSLYQEIEKRVTEVYLEVRAALELIGVEEELPDALIFMAQLAAERLPVARDEDPMRLYLGLVEGQLKEDMEALDHGHAFHIQLLRVKLSKDPAARSSALDAAALLAEMCPALVGPLRGGSSAAAGGGLAGAGGSGPQGQGAAGVDAGLGGPGAASLRRPPGPSKAGPGGQEKGEGAKDGPAPVGPKGGAGGTGWLPPAAAGVIKGVGLMMGGEPLEELALLVWPGSVGPGHWQPEYDLPPDMCEDLQWRYAPTAPKSLLLGQQGLTPAQAAWAAYAAAVTDVLVGRLPGLWSVASSPKYAQATDLPDSMRESMAKAQSLTRHMVDGIMVGFSARMQATLTALSRAGGPLAPSVQLVVQDLCRAWTALRDGGTTSKALDGVRAAVMGGLSLYAAGAQAHLAALPRVLFENEDWALDPVLLDTQPVTMLPRQLQEEVCTVMFYFSSLASHCEGVDMSSAASAWVPLRDGLFACFSAFTSCVTAFTEGLRQRVQAAAAAAAAAGGGASFGRRLNKSISMMRSREVDTPTRTWQKAAARNSLARLNEEGAGGGGSAGAGGPSGRPADHQQQHEEREELLNMRPMGSAHFDESALESVNSLGLHNGSTLASPQGSVGQVWPVGASPGEGSALSPSSLLMGGVRGLALSSLGAPSPPTPRGTRVNSALGPINGEAGQGAGGGKPGGFGGGSKWSNVRSGLARAGFRLPPSSAAGLMNRTSSNGGAAGPGGGANATSPFAAAAGVATAAAAAAAAAAAPLGAVDEVRMLVVVSNAGWVRERVFPSLVDRYRDQLEGATADGGSVCDSALKARCSELKRAASDLLSLYLSRREEAVAARVGAYVGLVTGPDTSAGSAGHGFPGSPSKLMHRGAGAGGGEGPAGASGEVRAVSDAASALVAYLSEVFSEVSAYCPRALRPVLAALVEHLVTQLASKYQELPPVMAPRPVLQLYADLMYLDYVLQAFLSGPITDDLQDCYDQLLDRMEQALRAHQKGGAKGRAAKGSQLQVLASAAAKGPDALSAAVVSACKGLVKAEVEQRGSHNVRCFTAFEVSSKGRGRGAGHREER